MFEEKNKEEIKPAMPDSKAPVVPSRLPEDLIDDVMKSGSGKGKIITFIIIGVIILGGISLGGYLLYQRFFGPEDVATEAINENTNNSKLTPLSENDQLICYIKNNPVSLNFFAQGIVRDAYQQIANQADFCLAELSDQPVELYALISQDMDGDGLNAFVESRIGTDDTKKDTDGDSHDDLTEINNGYNPAGAGKLEVFAW
ncbi:MAG: hypothetical protein ABIH38_04750 [Patescibacteria group bacterium]